VKVLYFDCFAGASGDMIVGALADLGADRRAARAALASLEIPGLRVTFGRAERHGLRAAKFRIRAPGPQPHRSLRAIRRLLRRASISPAARRLADGIFRRIAEVEATIHAVPVDRVHLHEVGAIDSIADVVAACVLLDDLGADRVVVSELPLGGGTVRAAHGVLPVPAPATLALLKGVPVRSGPVATELVTPTGAAVLTAAADAFGEMPPLRPRRSGLGAGDRDLAELPNLLRVIEGETGAAPGETVLVVEANLDDLNPQVYGHLRERLMAAGGLDVFYTAVQMKKDRPGTQVTVLCREEALNGVAEALFRESTTIGIRWQRAMRRELAREEVRVRLPGGTVRLKVSRLGDEVTRVAPEYDDCRELARRSGVPLREVLDAAARAFGGVARPAATRRTRPERGKTRRRGR
jgi:hypothetical protein